MYNTINIKFLILWICCIRHSSYTYFSNHEEGIIFSMSIMFVQFLTVSEKSNFDICHQNCETKTCHIPQVDCKNVSYSFCEHGKQIHTTGKTTITRCTLFSWHIYRNFINRAQQLNIKLIPCITRWLLTSSSLSLLAAFHPSFLIF